MTADDFLLLGTTISGLTLDAPVTLASDDRRRHMHVIGKTGTGKSTLLYALMLQDLEAGRGFALLDPHGDLAQAVIDSVPLWRTNDVLYLNPADLEFPIGFNLFDSVPPDSRALVTAHIVAAFKHLWIDFWGPRLEQILRNSVALLLDTPGSTLLGLSRLLVDEAYRGRLLANCRNPMVRAFWTQQIADWTDGYIAEALSPVQNKVDALLSPPILRHIIGQPHSTLDLSQIMNERRVLIANLSKSALGEGPAHLIGAFLATAFAQTAEARAAMPEADRVDFYLYVDEFQNFATDSFATILSEARKWRLSLTLSHQYLGQLEKSRESRILHVKIVEPLAEDLPFVVTLDAKPLARVKPPEPLLQPIVVFGLYHCPELVRPPCRKSSRAYSSRYSIEKLQAPGANQRSRSWPFT